MFVEVDRSKALTNRFPILLLDSTAEEAFAQAGDLAERSRHRAVGAQAEFLAAELNAAASSGGIVLVAAATSPFLGVWLDALVGVPARTFTILICPGREDAQRREAAFRRLERLAGRGHAIFPIFTDEIERRINCEVCGELRAAAQGFAVAAIIDALEHLAAPLRRRDFSDVASDDALAPAGFTAAMTLLPKPGIEIEEQARHLAERFFWPRPALEGAPRVLARIEVPRGTTERTVAAWRGALARRFARSIVSVLRGDTDADAPIRVSLVIPRLPLPGSASKGVRASRVVPVARPARNAAQRVARLSAVGR